MNVSYRNTVAKNDYPSKTLKLIAAMEAAATKGQYSHFLGYSDTPHS